VVGDVALDEERVRGVRKGDLGKPEVVATWEDLDGAFLAAAVTAFGEHHRGGLVPGQGVELVVEAVLVLLDGEYVVRRGVCR
jgi:hypothetical protein